MALNATTLGTALGTEIETQIRAYLSLGATPYPQLTEFAEGMAKAIADKVVAHIVSNATLNNAKFSGIFPGTVTGATCSTTITDEEVTGGIL